MKKYDVIIYGATGFTGRQAAYYFSTKKIKWAIAGRNKLKLEQLQKELKERTNLTIPYLVADNDAIHSVSASTKVLLNTAGPFSLCGESIVESCVNTSTDYVDITGETPYVRKLIDRFHITAKEKGVRIIPCCGFDSLPSDLGTLYVVDCIRKNLKQSCKQVHGYFQFKGGVNGGSWETAKLLLSNQKSLKESSNSYYLNPRPVSKRIVIEQTGPRYDTTLSKWTAPFFMSSVNTRIVRRSHALAEMQKMGYGEGFRYQESLLIDDRFSFLTASYISAYLTVFQKLSRYRWFRKLAFRWGPKPGQGPTEESIANGFFKCILIGTSEDNSQIHASIYSKGDPGNRSTVKMACESALHLVETERDLLPGGALYGGVLTPATGLGLGMVERLRKADIIIKYNRSQL